jgi:hypothetical protein
MWLCSPIYRASHALPLYPNLVVVDFAVVEVPSMFPRNVLVTIFISGLFACGRADYQTQHLVDFKIYTSTQDESLTSAISYLARRYNDDIGFEALRLTGDRYGANSFISFELGLKDKGDVLGLGQWTTVTMQDNGNPLAFRRTVKRTISYSMDLVFDRANFKRRVSNPDLSSGDWAHLYHLFCHEVGHGLQLDHSDDRKSVMYSKIPDQSYEDLDYSSYFREARSFFARNR